MTNRTERSHEQGPFDSRRTNRVSVVTPRNPAPAGVAQSPAPPEKDDAGESVLSSSDGV